MPSAAPGLCSFPGCCDGSWCSQGCWSSSELQLRAEESHQASSGSKTPPVSKAAAEHAHVRHWGCIAVSGIATSVKPLSFSGEKRLLHWHLWHFLPSSVTRLIPAWERGGGVSPNPARELACCWVSSCALWGAALMQGCVSLPLRKSRPIARACPGAIPARCQCLQHAQPRVPGADSGSISCRTWRCTTASST